MNAERRDLIHSAFFNFISFNLIVLCSGREVLDFIDINKLDRPNKPERRGRRGSFIGRLKAR